MENGKEETKVEVASNDAVDSEVKEKTPEPVSEIKENAAKEESKEPSDELLERIKDQIEFYFGDVNMQRDKFLRQQTSLEDGWVPIPVMLTFKLLASMTKDNEIILKAVELSDLMEISEDRKKIRRSPKHPLPTYDEKYRKAQEARTLYLKGFPMEGTTIEKLKTFFRDYEPFETIIMRKFQDKDKKMHFKGSIYVQFKNLDDAKAFMARESVKYEDNELIRKWSADYATERLQEKEEKRQMRSEAKGKKKDSVKKNDEKNGEENEVVDKRQLPKGCVIHFSNPPNKIKCKREDIKERLSTLGANIAFVDFKTNDLEGWIRLQEEDSAKVIFNKMEDGKIQIEEEEITCRVLEGEEEVKYLEKVKVEMASTRQKFSKGKKGGRRAQRKRRQSDNGDSGPVKKVAAE